MNFELVEYKIKEKKYCSSIKYPSTSHAYFEENVRIQNEFKKDALIALDLLEISAEGKTIFKHSKADLLFKKCLDLAERNKNNNRDIWQDIWCEMLSLKCLLA